jgi:hypothetical protein
MKELPSPGFNESSDNVLVPPYEGPYLPSEQDLKQNVSEKPTPLTEEQKEQAMRSWMAFYEDHLSEHRTVSLGPRIDRNWDIKRAIWKAQSSRDTNSITLAGLRLQSFANHDSTPLWNVSRRLVYSVAIIGLGLVTWNKAQDAGPELGNAAVSGQDFARAHVNLDPKDIDPTKMGPEFTFDGLRQFPPDFNRIGVTRGPDPANAMKPMFDKRDREVINAKNIFDQRLGQLSDKAKPALVSGLATLFLFLKRNPFGKGIPEKSSFVLPNMGKLLSGLGRFSK